MSEPLPGSARLAAAARFLRTVAGGGYLLPGGTPAQLAADIGEAAQDLGGALAGLLEEAAAQAETSEALLAPMAATPAGRAMLEASYPPLVRRALAVAEALRTTAAGGAG